MITALIVLLVFIVGLPRRDKLLRSPTPLIPGRSISECAIHWKALGSLLRLNLNFPSEHRESSPRHARAWVALRP